jgi:SAM-dependent methyltransferase
MLQLEEMAKGYDTSGNFDSVLAFFDVHEIGPHLSGDSVLEVGTSAGTVTRYLLPIAGTVDIVEGSRTGIERTKRNLGEFGGGIRYFHELWENFVPDREYSDVVFLRGLEHVDDPVGLLSRMEGWIKENGRVHIVVPNAHSYHRKMMKATGEIPDVYALRDCDLAIGHKRVYDADQLSSDIESSGLGVVHQTGFFFKPYPNSIMKGISMNPLNPIIQKCYEIGKMAPDMGAQLYAVGARCNGG